MNIFFFKNRVKKTRTQSLLIKDGVLTILSQSLLMELMNSFRSKFKFISLLYCVVCNKKKLDKFKI